MPVGEKPMQPNTSKITRWRVFYIVTAVFCGGWYLLYRASRIPQDTTHGDTFPYVYANPIGVLYDGLFIISLTAVFIIVVRLFPRPKSIEAFIAIAFFAVVGLIIILALLGPAIGDAFSYSFEHLDDESIGNRRYALAKMGTGIAMYDAFVLFECDQFMFRCREVYRENIFLIAMNRFHTDNLTAHLEISNGNVLILVNKERVYTYHPPD